VLSGQLLFPSSTINNKDAGKRKMPAKPPKSSKSSTRKRAAAASSKKRLKGKRSKPNPYESQIRAAVDSMLKDVGYIVGKLLPKDPNEYPSEGIEDRINALTHEFDNGSQDQTTHNRNIEEVLYTIAGIVDQYKIHGHYPNTQEEKPTHGPHEERVVELFKNINDICRDVVGLLDSSTTLPTQPGTGNWDAQAIEDLADDTQVVVGKIRYIIQHYHSSPESMFSK
jgi:hypothetical protein